MATPVAFGAGAVQQKVTRAFGQEQQAQKAKNPEKVKRGPTNQPTNQTTDGPTWRGGVT